jgi:hypothetical protein
VQGVDLDHRGAREQAQDLAGALLRRCRVLTGDELAVHAHTRRPVCPGAEVGSFAFELVLPPSKFAATSSDKQRGVAQAAHLDLAQSSVGTVTSSEKGTTAVRPTAASSALVNPVILLLSMMYFISSPPYGHFVLQCLSAATP